MKNSEIRIRVDGGFLVSHRNEDPDYDGVYICFESDDGDVTNIVFAETNPRNNNKVIDVYSYADIHSKESTSAFSIKTEDFNEATGTNSLLLKTIKKIEDLNYENKSTTQDPDTILTDLLDKADFKFPGISYDIFNIFEKSKDKEAVKEMFFEFVGVEFEEYLVKCLEEITREKSYPVSS